jgi:hypothetical protein
MFRHEANQLCAWAIISKPCSALLFILKHSVKQDFAVSTSLNSFRDVKVQNAERIHLHQLGSSCAHKQFFVSYFNKTDTPILLSDKIACMLVTAQLLHRCNHLG